MSFYSNNDDNSDYNNTTFVTRNSRKPNPIVRGLGRLILALIVFGIGCGVLSVITGMNRPGAIPIPSPIPGLLLTAQANHALIAATQRSTPTSVPATARSSTVVPTPARKNTLVPTPAANDETAQSQEALIVASVNAARALEGMGALRVNASLTTTAQLHSDDQADHDTMTHTGSDGSDPGDRVTRQGYTFARLGENVLMRWDMSADGAFDQWWNSPPHHENMMTPDFIEIGVAFTLSDEGAYYYTMVLGSPQSR